MTMVSIRNLSEIECFRAVAKYQSFSEAAKSLKLNKNSVSRFISNLEDRLGEKLFRRTTRKVYLTGFGEAVFKQSENFWDSLTALESQLSSSQDEPQGNLNLIASSSLSKKILYAKLKIFCQKYKKISLNLEFTDSGVETWDVNERHTDILFGFPHIPHLTDDWKYKQVDQVRNLFVASPQLIKKFSPLKTSKDLQKVPFITHLLRDPINCISLKNNKKFLVSNPVIKCNSFSHMKELCQEGLGLALLADFMVEEELKSGKLKSVLPNLPYLDFSLHVFCRASEYSSAKIRAFMDLF